MRIQFTIWHLLLLTTNIGIITWIADNFCFPWIFLEPGDAFLKASLLGVMLGTSIMTIAVYVIALKKRFRF
jgi:hypothetical protein